MGAGDHSRRAVGCGEVHECHNGGRVRFMPGCDRFGSIGVKSLCAMTGLGRTKVDSLDSRLRSEKLANTHHDPC